MADLGLVEAFLFMTQPHALPFLVRRAHCWRRSPWPPWFGLCIRKACGLSVKFETAGLFFSPTELDSPCSCHGSAGSFSFQGVLCSMSSSMAHNWLCSQWAGTYRFVRISSWPSFLISSTGNQCTAGRSQQIAILRLDFSGCRLDACL